MRGTKYFIFVSILLIASRSTPISYGEENNTVKQILTSLSMQPSDDEIKMTVSKLRELQITSGNLQEYLNKDRDIEPKALLMLQYIGPVDKSLIAEVKQIALITDNPWSEKYALAMLVQHYSQDEFRSIAIRVLPKVGIISLFDLIKWGLNRDKEWLYENKSSSEYIDRCVDRIERLYTAGILGDWPYKMYTAFFRSGKRFQRPENQRIIQAHLAAAHFVYDMPNSSVDAVFELILTQGVQQAPELVEKRLEHLIATAPVSVVKVVTWQIYVHNAASTETGKRLIDKAKTVHADIEPFIAAMNNSDFKGKEGFWGTGEAGKLTKQLFTQELRSLSPKEKEKLRTQASQPASRPPA